MGEPSRPAGPCCEGGPSDATALLAGAITYALGACAQVAPGEMTRPTPCTDWDLAALLAHLAASMSDLESAIRTGHLDLDLSGPQGPDVPDVPDVPGVPGGPGLAGQAAAGDLDGGDPLETVRDQAANLLFSCYAHHGPGRFVLVGGLPLPAVIVTCTGAVEIAVHGWDVSAARGRGGPIPPALATRMLGLCPLLVASRAGLFAPPVEVSPQASPGDQLVAYLGRSPAAPPRPFGRPLRT
jgi:uncharacterized protein (TIGR03083 family)